MDVVQEVHGPTWKGAAETIARYWNSIQSERVYTESNVYNYSPSGELAMIPFWYNEARAAGFVAEDDTRSDEQFKDHLQKQFDFIASLKKK